MKTIVSLNRSKTLSNRVKINVCINLKSHIITRVRPKTKTELTQNHDNLEQLLRETISPTKNLNNKYFS